VGNGVNVEYFRRPLHMERRERELVFVGALDYAPNALALSWFCARVWPRLRAAHPDIELHVVGRRPSRAVRSLAGIPGVTLHADVPDVRPYLHRATLSIVPLQVARGIQNKVLEALASETPVVASSAALEGLELTPGQEVAQADAPDDWVNTILALCRDEPARRRMAQLGRSFVEQHHQWNERLQPLDDLLDAVIADGVKAEPAGVPCVSVTST
jgi:glycosyltransferase involved in cell wall biosynthesis